MYVATFTGTRSDLRGASGSGGSITTALVVLVFSSAMTHPKATLKPLMFAPALSSPFRRRLFGAALVYTKMGFPVMLLMKMHPRFLKLVMRPTLDMVAALTSKLWAAQSPACRNRQQGR